ncbi:MAG: hypothetical protein ACD_39C00170G0002 [uncultured bacterium]|nr:MAG: hypothetical protein ACD_39C00170G0002 [uncultured bacterium]
MSVTFKQLLNIILAALILTSTSVYAEPEWIDATHLFEEELKEIVSTVDRETLNQQAARFKTEQADRKPYEVGDVETFWTKNIVDNVFEPTKAVVKAVGKHCYIFLEEGKNLSSEAIEKVRKNFDEVIYPTDTTNFGSEWKPGIDGDERITLLMFDIKDGYNGSGGFVGGYFYAADSYLQEKLPEHIKSNEREMFYLDINPSDPGSDRYGSTIAHEFQHMIHFNQDPSEYTWVNEACSQIAPYLCGFGHANQVHSFMRTPDNSLTAWAKEQMLANYGQVYLWNYYIMTNFIGEKPEARADFFRKLVASKKQGVAGYVEALGNLSQGFTGSFDSFCITNFINDTRLGDNGSYAYDKSLARFKLPVSETLSVLPAEVAGEIYLWSADAVKFDLTRSRSELEISFSGLLGRFGEDLYNSFTVALIMANSRGQVEPRISYMNVDKISGQLQGGKIVASADDNYDTATLIIIAQAPEEVDDRLYAKAKSLPYTVKIVDKGAQVARSTSRADVKPLITAYAEAAASLDAANEAALMISMNSIADAGGYLTRTISAELATGNSESLDVITQMLDNGEVDAENIRPILRQLADVAQFNAEAGSSDALRLKATQLRAY